MTSLTPRIPTPAAETRQNEPMSIRAPGLPRYYPITALGTLMVLVGVALIIGHQVATQRVMDAVAAEQSAFIREFNAAIWPQYRYEVTTASFLTPDNLHADQSLRSLNQAILTQVKGTSIIRVDLYLPDGLLAASTQSDLVGTFPALSESVESAQNIRYYGGDGGDTRIVHYDSFDSIKGPLQGRSIAQTVTVLWSRGTSGTNVATMEVSSDVTADVQAIRVTEVAIGVPVFLLLAAGIGLAVFWPGKAAGP